MATVPSSPRSGLITWQDAEEALLEAVELLGRMPDRESGWLARGKGLRSTGWPEIIRNVRDGDYGDSEARPRSGLTRREVDHVERMLLGADAAALAVPARDRALVGRVLVGKLDGRGEGFSWSRVWAWDDARRVAAGERRVTSDAVRKAYERAVGKVAVAMGRAVR